MAFPVAPGYNNLPNGNFVPTIFSKNVLRAFRKTSVVPEITNTDYYGEISGFGDTVNVLIEPEVVVQPYQRGTQTTPTPLVDNQIQLTINQGDYFEFLVDDIEVRQSHVDWMSLATDRAAYSLRDAYDQNVLTFMSANAGVTIGATGSPQVIRNGAALGEFTPLNFLNSLDRRMNEANIPLQDRWFVGDPRFFEMLKAEDSRLASVNFSGLDKTTSITGQTSALEVFPFKLSNFKLYSSNNLQTVGNGSGGVGANNYVTLLAGHKSAVASANQIAKTETLRSQTSFADVTRGLHVYGRAIVRASALFRIYYNNAQS